MIMEKDERAKQVGEKTGQGKKEEAGQNTGQPQKEQAVQATTVNGLKALTNDTLIEIVQNSSARPETRVAALREIHGRSGCQYSGLERLDIGILKRVVEDKRIPPDLRTAAADALAIPRTADKNK